MQDFEKLLSVARRKTEYDKNNPWFKGAHTYLASINEEVAEVMEELPLQRNCYLEDELADVFWTYINAVLALEKETDIKFESVLNRAYLKYQERISGIESGISWQAIKQKQQQRLELEQAAKSSNS